MQSLIVYPFLAASSGALQFAFEKVTTEGKATIFMLIIVSIFSWTVMITKAIQLYRATKNGKKFFKAYRATRWKFSTRTMSSTALPRTKCITPAQRNWPIT